MTRFFSHAPTALLTTLLLVSLALVGCNLDEDSGEMLDDNEQMMDDQVVAPKKEASSAPTCGEKNAVCETSDDCCGSMGLECQEVRTSDGGFGKRCLPVEVVVCRSDCVDGVWGGTYTCDNAVAPKDMIRCEDFVGDPCTEAASASRNTRECVET